MKTIGIDPGLSGAIALYDSETGALKIESLQVAKVKTGIRKTHRRQLDLVSLQTILAAWVLGEGAELALLEKVSASPQQGVSSAFSFGRVYGQLEACLISMRLRIERVSPVQWKRAMKCPADAAAIAQRADEVFPEYRALWRGPRGGVLHDRAEAALLAKYAAQEFGD